MSDERDKRAKVKLAIGDEEQALKRSEKQLGTRKQEIADLREVLSTPAGFRLFKRIIREAQVFRTPFDSTSHAQTGFNAGMKVFANRWLNEIAEIDRNVFTELLIEEKE